MSDELIKELSRLQLLSSRCKNKMSMCPLSITLEENRAYLIFNYIKELQQENQELKLELSGYRQAILNDKEMLGLKEENDKLKKQFEELKDKINWYENFEVNKTIDKLRLKHNNQQKEFIKWLEDYLKLFDNMCIDEQGYYDMCEEILQKYRSIIGVSDDKTN